MNGGNCERFFQVQENVHKVCNVIIIVSTQLEDEFNCIKQKQRLYISYIGPAWYSTYTY